MQVVIILIISSSSSSSLSVICRSLHFVCFPTTYFQESDREGAYLRRALVRYYSLGDGRLFGGGCLLEDGRLFKEIQYLTQIYD